MKKLILIFLGMVLLSGFVSGAYRDDVVGRFSMNDADIVGANVSINDLSNNSNNMVIGSAVTTGVAGKLGEAFSFTRNVNNYLQNSSPSGLQLRNQSWTITLWVKYGTDSDTSFLFGTTGNRVNAVEGDINGADEKIGGWIANTRHQSAAVNVDGVWQWLVYRYDGSQFEIWLNNSIIVNASESGVPAQASDLLIGTEIQGAGNSLTGHIDEFCIWDRLLTLAEITEGWASSSGKTCEIPPPTQGINVTLQAPPNNTISNNQTQLFIGTPITIGSIPDTCNLLGNFSGSWETNQTNSSGLINNTNVTFTIDALPDGNYNWNINCSNNVTNVSRGANNFTLTIDVSNPVIIPSAKLDGNLTVVFNGTLIAQINFTDNRELYSINISESGDGRTLFNISNIGATSYSLNLSAAVSTTISNTLNITVCDSSTAELISDIDNKVDKQGLKYIMQKKFLIFDDEWIHIYPKDYTNYNTPETIKEIDRYLFTFNKNTNPNAVETFVVESSNRIDIPKMQIKDGHLVIPDIGNGYWIDFVNIEAEKVTITRINENKVEINVYGLKSKKIVFNSLGELNCVSEIFYFGNLNPTQQFLTRMLANTSTEMNLTITEDPITVRNATAILVYNVTQIGEINTSNFTVTVTTPSTVGGNSSNVSFTWILTVNGETQNLTTSSHTVDNFLINNCTELNIQAINFTLRDEENNTIITQDLTGVFTYNIGTGLNKSFTFSATSIETYQICIFPNYVSINADYTMTYESGDRQQRTFRNPSAILTNASVEVPLYSLNNSLGLFVRFRVIDSFQNPLDDVLSQIKRTISGVLRTVEQKFTDDSGLVTFFADPNILYTFVFSKLGYETETFDLRPTAIDIFTVTMTSTVPPDVLPPPTTTSYSFEPKYEILKNNTEVNFIFNLTMGSRGIRIITNCTFFLKNGSTIINQSSTTFSNTNCDILIIQNTDNYTRIIAEAQYTLNETINVTVSRTYRVREVFTGQFSLINFFNDIKNFTASGFNDDTRMLIALILIISITGAISSKFTLIREPEKLIYLMVSLVLFFSIVGFLNVPFDLPKLPGLRESFLPQYAIFILFSLVAGSYLIKREKR